MRYPVVYQQAYTRICEEIGGLFGGCCRWGCHYYSGGVAEGCAGEVGVVHEGDVRLVGVRGCEMELEMTFSIDF